MVCRKADNAFMALLRSYHSRRFCRAAVVARKSVAGALQFSTSNALRLATDRSRSQNGRPDFRGPNSQEAEPIQSKDVQVPRQVAVIGSGITGLTTAHYLAKWLPETSHITIYEASKRVGGWVDTQTIEVEVGGKRNPVRFERGPRTLRGMGMDTWKFDDLVLWDLIRDLNLAGDYIGLPTLPRYIYYPDHIVNMAAANVFTEPVFTGVIPGLLTALIRRMKARSRPHASDMSVSDFIEYATGRPELTDNMASAIIHGIWGGDADRLSMRSFMPAQWWRFFYKPKRGCELISKTETGITMTLGSDTFLNEALKATQKDRLVVFKNGMSSLPNSIETGLRKRKNVTFKLGEPVTNLNFDRSSGQVQVSTKESRTLHPYDKVISTTTSNALSAMAPGKLPSLAKSPNVSILAVNLWYPEPALNHSHRGVGYLVPRSVEDNIEGLLGVFFDSDVLPRAPGEPEGTKLFVLMGGHYWDNFPSPPSTEEGIQMAKAVVERHLGIPADKPCFATAQYARDCIPQHHVGHWERMGLADSELQSAFGGKLAVAGGSYTSIGVTAGIRAAYDLASHIAQSAQDHVGETGLAQFQTLTPSLCNVSREKLRLMGRDL